jgi:uncharacterized membrane protein HdeD (DUF308 family)
MSDYDAMSAEPGSAGPEGQRAGRSWLAGWQAPFLLGLATLAIGAAVPARPFRSLAALAILAGIVLIRHLHLTVALIGLFIGVTWIIAGVAALAESASGDRDGAARVWPVIFAIISLAAGVVVISAPIASVTALTLFLGVWLIVIGAVEMPGSLIYARAAAKRPGRQARVPEQRVTRAGVTRDAGGGRKPRGPHVPR